MEDEAPNRALLRAVVSRASDQMVRDAVVLEAHDLSTARALLAQGDIDLLLLDVRLPDGNGLDLAREMRDGVLARPTRVIVMSASVRPAEQDDAISAGADEFVSKPYDPKQLALFIADWLLASPLRA